MRLNIKSVENVSWGQIVALFVGMWRTGLARIIYPALNRLYRELKEELAAAIFTAIQEIASEDGWTIAERQEYVRQRANPNGDWADSLVNAAMEMLLPTAWLELGRGKGKTVSGGEGLTSRVIARLNSARRADEVAVREFGANASWYGHRLP